MDSFSLLPKLDLLRMASLLALKCCEFSEQAIYPHKKVSIKITSKLKRSEFLIIYTFIVLHFSQIMES